MWSNLSLEGFRKREERVWLIIGCESSGAAARPRPLREPDNLLPGDSMRAAFSNYPHSCLEESAANHARFDGIEPNLWGEQGAELQEQKAGRLRKTAKPW